MSERVIDKVFGMSSAAREVMRCLFLYGPTWDGDVPSKMGRGELVKKGFAEHEFGFAWLTRAGMEFAIQSMEMDRAKEQREAVARKSVGPKSSRENNLRNELASLHEALARAEAAAKRNVVLLEIERKCGDEVEASCDEWRAKAQAAEARIAELMKERESLIAALREYEQNG
jgi:hypothetical protein